MQIPQQSWILGPVSHSALSLAVKSHQNKERLLEPLAQEFRRWQEEGILSFLVCQQKEQAKRLAELLKGYDLEVMFSSSAIRAGVLRIR